ncbi:hypothetical protein CSC17_5940 (plasmid) [Klebsiella oxytoca]|nr:hypothetical protein CSC17_5940 [Klebsiella oxytoca]
MPAFEWVHVLFRQQKMTMSLSPANFCNSASREMCGRRYPRNTAYMKGYCL